MLRLDEILKEKGINVSELEGIMKSRGTKLSRLSISKIINQETSPKVSTLQSIADALQIDITDMFYSKEDKTPLELLSEIKSTLNKLEDKI